MTNPYLIKLGDVKLTTVQIALHNSILCLMKTKKLSEISVRSLCEKAQVARSSFYAHYENTDNLLNEIENKIVKEISNLDKNIVDSKRIDASDFVYFSDVIEFINKNTNELTTLLITNYDYRLVEKWKKAIKSHLWQRLELTKATPKQDFIFEMVASEVISAFIYHLKNPNRLQKNDIYQIIAARLSDLSKIEHFL